jgi:hypothetical protein
LIEGESGWDIGNKPEHDPLNNNNYTYIFRNIKTLNYVLFLLCVCLIYQSWMFVLLMMPHVGPMIRQYNIFYSILTYVAYEWRVNTVNRYIGRSIIARKPITRWYYYSSRRSGLHWNTRRVQRVARLMFNLRKRNSSVLMRFLCKTSHKDSCAWPCLTWHCQPIKSAEYNQWSPLLPHMRHH